MSLFEELQAFNFFFAAIISRENYADAVPGIGR
jgi:hypothetical protein